MYYVLAFLLSLTAFSSHAFEYGWVDQGGSSVVESTTRTEAQPSRLTLDYYSNKPIFIYAMKRGLTNCDHMQGAGVVYVGNVPVAGERYCAINSKGGIDAGWVFEGHSWEYLNKVFSDPRTKAVQLNDESFPTHNYQHAVSTLIQKLEAVQKEAVYNH